MFSVSMLLKNVFSLVTHPANYKPFNSFEYLSYGPMIYGHYKCFTLPALYFRIILTHKVDSVHENNEIYCMNIDYLKG